MRISLHDTPSALDHDFLRTQGRNLEKEKKATLLRLREDVARSNPVACLSRHEIVIRDRIVALENLGHSYPAYSAQRGRLALSCLCQDREKNPNCAHNCLEGENLTSNPYKSVIRALIQDGVLVPESDQWVSDMQLGIFYRDARAQQVTGDSGGSAELSDAVRNADELRVQELHRVRGLLLGILDGLLDDK
jgi:hypothetical protein